MMLDFLGYPQAHDLILSAIEEVLASGPKTRDLGGSANTQDVGKAIANAVATATLQDRH
jgi:tartrate dehydrogenase/decarboxylase/D-malate dehydrogenase